jgi:hypothetical protein
MARETLILAGVEKTQAAALRRLADNMRIAVVEVAETQYDCTIGDIAEQKPAFVQTGKSGTAADGASCSLLVFANVTDKHVDKLLFEMKSRKITVDYKAVMTDTNRQWSVKRTMFEMERERQAFEGARKS